MAIPEGLNGMNGKAWARAARERIGMTQHDVAVLANFTVDMVKKYESEKYRIQPSERMREMLEHYLAEHRRAVAAIVERHRGEERATLSFSRVSNLPDDMPDWIKAESSVKRHAAVREAAVHLHLYARRNEIEKREGRPIMFGLYMLTIYLGVAIIAAGFVALLVVVALAVGLFTHPIRTFALVFHKLAALAAGLALILAMIAWFWTDHAKPDFVPCFWGSIGVIVASIIIRALAEWILERPTRAERRAMKRVAAPTFDSRL